MGDLEEMNGSRWENKWHRSMQKWCLSPSWRFLYPCIQGRLRSEPSESLLILTRGVCDEGVAITAMDEEITRPETSRWGPLLYDRPVWILTVENSKLIDMEPASVFAKAFIFILLHLLSSDVAAGTLARQKRCITEKSVGVRLIMSQRELAYHL